MQKFIDTLLIAFWVFFCGVTLLTYYASATTHPRPEPYQWSVQAVDGEERIIYQNNK